MSTGKEPISQNTDAVKPIYSITPFTLLDYPDKTACILWFAGCNMRCLYCYNPDIVLGKGKLSFKDALKFISSRKNLLDGVVLSGGECTLHKDLISLLQEIKKNGMLIKVDTNGTKPDVLQGLIQQNLIDYIALDFKSPSHKFAGITKADSFADFNNTLKLLVQSQFAFEVRTTVHTDLLNIQDIQHMSDYLESIGYTGNYYLQNYVNDSKTLGDMNNTRSRIANTEEFRGKLKLVLRN